MRKKTKNRIANEYIKKEKRAYKELHITINEFKEEFFFLNNDKVYQGINSFKREAIKI